MDKWTLKHGMSTSEYNQKTRRAQSNQMTTTSSFEDPVVASVTQVTLQSKVYSSQYPSTGFIVSRPICYAKSLQSCPSLCDPMDYSPPGSSVHVIFQARILEWVTISCSITMVKSNHASEKSTKSDHTK